MWFILVFKLLIDVVIVLLMCVLKSWRNKYLYFYIGFFLYLSMYIYYGLMLLEIWFKFLYNNGKRMLWNIWRESIEFF